MSTTPVDSDTTVKVAIVDYSSTGSVHALADAAREGAEKQGAEVRLRRAAELAPPEAIASNAAWAAHAAATADVTVATHDDWSGQTPSSSVRRRASGCPPLSSSSSSTPPVACGPRDCSPTRSTQP